jgi:hypothetical protein
LVGGGVLWSGFFWHRIGIGDVQSWMRWWTFGFWRHAVSEWLSKRLLTRFWCFWHLLLVKDKYLNLILCRWDLNVSSEALNIIKWVLVLN